jgi:hypothetical protein
MLWIAPIKVSWISREWWPLRLKMGPSFCENIPCYPTSSSRPYLADTLNCLYLEQVRISWPMIRKTIRWFDPRPSKLKSDEIQETSDEYFRRILNGIDPFSGLSKSYIQATIKSAAGQKNSDHDLRLFDQETNPTFEGTIPGLRAFCSQGTAGYCRKFSGWTLANIARIPRSNHKVTIKHRQLPREPVKQHKRERSLGTDFSSPILSRRSKEKLRLK